MATYDGTWLLLYVDGKVVDSRTAQDVLVALPPPFSLGHVGANAFSASFIGTLDEAAIYDRALDGGIVAVHCAAGRGWPDGGAETDTRAGPLRPKKPRSGRSPRCSEPQAYRRKGRKTKLSCAHGGAMCQA